MNTLKQAVDQRALVPLQTNDTRCGFGHFYYSVQPKNPEVRKIWDLLKAKHQKLHGLGETALKKIEKKDFDELDKLYQEAESCSGELIADFEEIIRIVEKLSREQIKVME